MYNRRPIFVNGFSRGGTTILMNMLASHPDVCTVEEVHHLFKGHNLADSPLRIFLKCVLHDAPAIALTGQDFFSPRCIRPRKRLSPTARRLVDRVLYKEKLRMRDTCFNRFKRENIEYTRQEIADARLLGKNLDGLIYATDTFAEMYPDVTFIGLVRDGLALCESHLRRKRPAAEIGYRYRVLGQQMMADRQRFRRYMLLRFEELLADPLSCIRRLFLHTELDQPELRSFRMQVRRVMDADGIHRLTGGDEWEVVWLDIHQLQSYFRADVNQNQIKRLSAADRDAFLREAGDTMEALGYSTSIYDEERQGHGVPFPIDRGTRKAA